MSFLIRNVDDKYILLQAKGEVSVNDFEQVNEHIYADADEHLVRYQVVDLADVTNLAVSTADIQRIAARDRVAAETLGNIAIAIVVSADLEYGLSRMWEAYVSTTGIETNVFRDLAAAEAWILTLRNDNT